MTQTSAQAPGRMPAYSIRAQLIGAIGLILLLLTGASLISVYAFSSMADMHMRAERANATLVRAADLDSAVSHQTTALLSYAITGDVRWAQALSRDADRVSRLLERLSELTARMPEWQRRLERLAELQSRWATGIVQPLMQRIQTGARLDRERRFRAARRSAALLDPMHETLDALRSSIAAELGTTRRMVTDNQQQALWALLAVLGLSLLIGAAAVTVTVRRVASPLVQLARTTRRLAKGDSDVSIGFRERPDEIGAVARALEQSRKAMARRETEGWVSMHHARLMETAQACDNEQALCERIVGELAPLLGAPYAVLFTREDGAANGGDSQNAVELKASYGYTHSAQVATRFAEGEGLVGQALRERETIIISPVPADYVRIASGLGDAAPATLIVAPALYRRRVLAVLEIALFRALQPHEQELLDSLLPSVAVALRTLGDARRTELLLKRSREQAQALLESEQTMRDQKDRLSDSNEELRTRGEELKSQAEQLRASEEELKVQAEELQTGNEELREKQELMQEQTAELSRLHEEAAERAEALEQASRYKSDFMANMSHELRTPLNSLLILSRSLADNEEGNLGKEQVEAAGIIHESGSTLLDLINDILDLAKIEAGKMQVSAATVSIAAVAKHLERQFAHVAEEKGLDFIVHATDDAPQTLVTDGAKLDQVLNNLIGNALKFTERGGVRVTFTTPEPGRRFADSDLTPETALAVHVADDGIGIAADRLGPIFEAFEQVDSGTSRAYGGTGLGLSITRELVQLLGGEIAVQSREGHGSTFSVYISRELAAEEVSDTAAAPAENPARAPVPVAAPEMDRENAAPGRRRLLIIDDDAPFAQIVARAARGRGFDCILAADGESGLAEAQQQPPSAIVLDLGLPGMDGWTVLDKLKASPRTKNVPVHIVSAADDTGRYKRHGAVAFLQKPIQHADLQTIFTRVNTLSGRQPHRLLVVDDDRDAHAAITHLLRNETAEIVAADTGADALAALDRDAFDCVVLDLRLPDISGFDLLEKLSARDDAPPVVVYSARDLSAAETRRLRTHTDSIVVKGERAQERLLDEISLFFHYIGGKAARPEPVADSHLAEKTVLVVDDDMRNTFALSRVLRSHGLKVLMASDGAKALAQLESQPQIDLVLMDIMMPGMDGYETIGRIREQPRFADLPIIALTAKAMTGDREKCLEAGADGYLPKPLDTDALLTKMKALV